MVRRLCAVLLIVSFAMIGLTGCKKDTPAGKGFRFPLSGEPRQIDPQVSTDPASVTLVAALFEGLARLDEDGKAVPAAADWTVSEDGLVYTFSLKESKWNDETPVTAHDFVFGMQRAVMPSTRSTLAEQLFMIHGAYEVNQGTADVSALGVKAIDEKTLEIILVEPDDEFPAKTAATPFMPCKQSFFEKTGGRYGLEVKYVLSNGPFYLKRWNHGESLLLNKNEGYFDAKSILPAAVRYVIGTVENPIDILTAGNLDAAEIPSDQLQAAKDAGLTLIPQEDTIQYIWLNNRVAPLSNLSVRTALRDALEWDILNSQLKKESTEPAKGFVAPDAVLAGEEKYRQEGNSRIPVSRGREALSVLEQGLAQQELPKMPKLKLLCADDEYSMNLARYIVQSWQKNLSVYFDIEAVKSSELRTRMQVGNYQIALWSTVASGMSAVDAFSGFVTGEAGNYAHFTDPGYDEAFRKIAVGNVTREEAETLENILWEACPSIPLSFEKRFIGIPASDSGIIVRPFGGGSFGAPFDFRGAGKLDD